MKKSKLIAYVGSGVLVISLIIGIILLVRNESVDAEATIYESIVLTIGVVGVLMAIATTIHSTAQERKNNKMMHEVDRIARTESEDAEVLKEILKKLDDHKRKK